MIRKYLFRVVIVLAALVGLLGLGIHLGRKGEPIAGSTTPEPANRTSDVSGVSPSDGAAAGEHRGKSSLRIDAKSGLTPVEASEILRKFYASNRDLKKRSDLLCEMISQLCEEGYSAEAWDLIDSGYGLLRKNSLKAFFGNAQLSQEQIVDLLRRCDGQGDLSDAMSGYLTRFKPEELLSVATDPHLAGILAEMQKAGHASNLSIWLAYSLQAAKGKFDSSDSVVSSTAMDLYSKGLLKANDVMTIAKYEDPGRIFQNWDQLNSLSTKDQREGAELRGKRIKMISVMITVDAPKAMGLLLGSKGGGDFGDVQTAVESWNRADARGAADWYETTKSSFTPEQQTMVTSSFAYEAYHAGQLEVARQWMELIQDPEMRAEALKGIDKELNATSKPEVEKP